MNEIMRGLILTAGPSISSKEIDLVVEAVTQGWNSRHSEFIRNFQTAFAEYIGVKYAMCTSSCTGALHLSFAALGLKAGDEVLVPENTWVASGIAPTYVGAKPVFVDIEEDTWCMSPESIERHITPRTKAIVPVHLYGHPCDMDAVMAIAKKHGLKVIEDAAPAVGSEWRGAKAGSFGDTAAFSFQGAKIMVCGEGGMFVTNDEAVYKKAQYLNDYAVDTNKSFWIDEVGFKYRMSNLQAAIGLGQLQRINEIVDRKRQIFAWYKERLGGLPEFALNAERPNAKNNFWMTSIVLAKDLKIERDDFRKMLKEAKVDSRPFFYPMSSLPMFERKEKENPTAYSLATRGINMPSGHNLTEDDIDYISGVVLKILGKGSRAKASQPGPITKMLSEKNQPAPKVLRLSLKGGEDKGALELMTYGHVDESKTIEALASLRKASADWSFSRGDLSLEGTRKWLREEVLDVKDKVLFLVKDVNGAVVGCAGFGKLKLDGSFIEVENTMFDREDGHRELMHQAMNTMLDWRKKELAIAKAGVRVFNDNHSCLNLFKGAGFREIQRMPVKASVDGSTGNWKEIVADPFLECKRYIVSMVLD